MVRTQIQLTEEQARALKGLAAERGVSMAALVREAVDRALGEGTELDRKWQRALSVVGKYRGGGGRVSEEHDEYFVDSVLDEWKSS
jgi:predicted DNA-binding protein